MKNYLLLIIFVFASGSLFSQNVSRVGPYEVTVYQGKIIDITLVDDPAVYYKIKPKIDTVVRVVHDTLPPIIKYVEKVEKKEPLRESWAVNAGFSSPGFSSKRIDNHWNVSPGFDLQLGASYRKPLGNSGLTLDIGLSLELIKKEMKFNSYRETLFDLVDKDNDPYEGNFTYLNVQEKTTLLFVGIPIMFEVGNPAYNRVSLCGSFGLRPAFAVYNKFSSSGKYDLSGRYNDWSVLLYDIPELGFVTNQAFDGSSNEIKPSMKLTGKASFGVMIPLASYDNYKTNKNMVKIALFGEYGKIFTKKGDPDYPDASYYIGQNNLLSDPVSVACVGLEIGLVFGNKH